MEQLFTISLNWQMTTFLCPRYLKLRDQVEQYINGHYTYETNCFLGLESNINELKNKTNLKI